MKSIMGFPLWKKTLHTEISEHAFIREIISGRQNNIPLTPTKGVHALISGTNKNVTLCGKRDFAYMIK